MRKIIRIFSLILTLVLSLPICSNAYESTSYNGQISAQHACVYIPKLNKFIYGKNENERHSMASTTKIMTALVALENRELDYIVTISPEAVGIEGSSVYLKANDKYYLKDLLYAILLQSANDAAAAVAIDIGESIEGFSELMNLKAKKLGLKDTHFDNPHGLDSDNHYTTAKELAIITAEALKNPTFKSIVSTYRKTISTIDGDCARTVVNHNKMLLLYQGAFGVKTGYTKKTGRCLVSAAEKNGLTIISVTLNAPSDWNDHKMLLDFGFNGYENRLIAEKGEFSYTLPIINGEESTVCCSNTEELFAILEKNAVISKRVELNRILTAPIKKGDIVGYIYFEYPDNRSSSLPIVAETDVNEIKYKKGPFGFLNPTKNYVKQ